MRTVAIVFAVVQLMPTAVNGAPIQYSWSGQLVLDGSADPWQLGANGAAFNLIVTVTQDSPDLSDDSVIGAEFEVEDAHLSIDGALVDFIGDGYLEFAAYPNAVVDLITFAGVFDRAGQKLEIGSIVALPAHSFHLLHDIEPPPYFPPTLTSDPAAYGHGPYTAFVGTGTLVFMIPEQSSLHAAVISLCLIALCGCRNRT
jgi:hypothetical protein